MMESKEFKTDVEWLLNGEAVQGSQVKNEPNGVLNRPIKQVHENTIILKESIVNLTSELDALIVNWNNSLANLTSDKNQIDEKIEDLKLQMAEIANAELDPVFVKSVDDRFVNVNADISKNAADIASTGADIIGLNSALELAVQNTNQLATDTNNRFDDFALSYDESLIALSGNIDAAGVDINGLKTDVAKNTTDIATATTDVNKVKVDVAKNTTDIATANTDISKLKTDLVSTTASATKNTNDINTANTDIGKLKTDVAQNTATIESQGIVIESLVSDNETVNATLQSHSSYINMLTQGNPDLEYSYGPWDNRPEVTANGNYHFDTDSNKPYWKVDGVWYDANGVEHT